MVDDNAVDHMREQPGLNDQQQPTKGPNTDGGGERQSDFFGTAAQPGIKRLRCRTGDRSGM